MQRILFFVIVCASLFYACDNRELQEEVDDSGIRTEYYVDKSTGLKEGLLRQFNDKGVLIAEENYVAGELHGERKLYNEQGIVVIREQYKNNEFEGEYRNYHDDGTLKQQGKYINGAMNETWKAYYPNGSLREVVTFVENQENGPFREWYETGKPKASGTYLNGDNEHGTLHLYETDGTLRKVMTCDRGRCSTVWASDSTGLAPVGVDMSLPVEDSE